MDYGRQGSNANITSQFEEDPWEILIADAHSYVDMVRKRKRLTPWVWSGASAQVQTERIAEHIMAEKTSTKSGEVARNGINTGADFAKFMGALMADLVEGTIDPQVASAACKAGEKLLKVVEMQIRHGRDNKDGSKTLQLTEGKP